MKTFLTWKEVKELTGLSESTISRMEKKGMFPARRQLSTRRVGWLREEVIQWASTRNAGPLSLAA